MITVSPALVIRHPITIEVGGGRVSRGIVLALGLVLLVLLILLGRGILSLRRGIVLASRRGMPIPTTVPLAGVTAAAVVPVALTRIVRHDG